MTAELPGQGGCGRMPVRARFRHSPVRARFRRGRGQCRCPPAVTAPPQPANAEARREARSTRQCPTVTTKAVEDLEDRSPKFPPNLNRSPKCSSGNSWTKASVEFRSANGCPKCVSKPEALVEVGILDVDATVDCKCQEHN